MSAKPASAIRPRSRSASAKAKGPGASGSAGGGLMSSAWRAAISGAIAHGLSRGARQHTKAQRPPGRSEVRSWRSAAAGWSKNIRPKREYSRSCAPGSRASAASASTKSSGSVACAAARRRAASSIGFEMSTPSTRPRSPTACASASEALPQPQPMSITRSPGWGAAACSAAWPKGSIMRSSWRWNCTQRCPCSPFQSAICSAL